MFHSRERLSGGKARSHLVMAAKLRGTTIRTEMDPFSRVACSRSRRLVHNTIMGD